MSKRRKRSDSNDSTPSEEIEVSIPGRRILKKIKVNPPEILKQDDKDDVPNIMLMSKEERLHYLNNTYNPFGYPKEYWEIYLREKARRNLQGFENLLKINNVKLFTNNTNQLLGKIIIKNHNNVNCIKSREDYNLDFIENIEFNQEAYNILLSKGMFYVEEYSFYIERMKTNDEGYNKSLKDTIDNFYMEKLGRTDLISYRDKDFTKEDEIIYEITQYYISNFWYPQYFDIKSKQNCDIYDCIIVIIKEMLGEYYQFVNIAGGFALSMYVYKNYGYHIGFNDIDLFIHSCDKATANIIVNKLVNFYNLKHNENAIIFNLYDINENGNGNNNLLFSKIRLNIQIIKRLYSCPQEIIVGFDVDCCCILTTLDGDIWISERGANSIINGYNIINFEKMSPSYEYRILKYRIRGFAIWIPFMDFFKYNAIFELHKFSGLSGANIILRNLVKYLSDNVVASRSSMDYVSINGEDYTGDYIDFKTLNPNEQTINTFHRVFLDDPKDWYPIRHPHVIDYFNLNSYDNESLVEINNLIVYENLMARNIIRRRKIVKISRSFASKVCYNILTFIHSLNNNIVVYGSFPKGAIFGCTGDNIIMKKDNTLDEDLIKTYTKIYIAFTKYSSMCYKLLNYEMNLNGFETMNQCRYIIVRKNIITIDNVDTVQFEKEEINILDRNNFEAINRIINFKFFTEEQYQHYETNNLSIYDITLEIILPSSFNEIHRNLLYKDKYQYYTATIKQNLEYEVNKLYMERKMYIPLSNLKRKDVANIKREIRESIKQHFPVIEYEEYIRNNPYLDNLIIHFCIYNKINFIAFEDKVIDFQFKDRKLYGTEYNIIKNKYLLDGIDIYKKDPSVSILEYPVIEDFTV